MKRFSTWCGALFAAALLLMQLPANKAAASASCSLETPLPNFIWLLRTLTGGTAVTIETANITGDTVMHLLRFNPSGGADNQWVQVASNDDSNGLASKIVFTPPATDTYRILVRSYGSTTTGVADVVIDGTTVLTQNPYGSNVLTTGSWSTGERVRVTPTRRNLGGQDPMVFVLSSVTQVVQSNDDSGPNLYPTLNISQNGTSSSRIVWGHYPGSSGTNFGRLTIEPVYAASGDADGDLVMGALETACGINDHHVDSDLDTIPDALELFGNDGFSFSLGSQHGYNHTTPNLYVEVDTMNLPASVPVPFANLAADMATIFNTDDGLDLYVETDGTAPSLPYTQNISLTNCGTVPNCVVHSTLKATNFSQNNPERQPYFHYAIYGDRQVTENNVGTPATSCSSGRANILGSNLIVTLGATCAGTAASPALQQRGTVMHELGHNLNLTHNGNDQNNHFSTVHVSVMNYRYQFGGVPGRAGVLTDSYSVGANGCESCTTSPKQACIDSRAVNGNNCVNVTPRCDCDNDEWNYWLSLDFLHGTPNPGPGAGGASKTARVTAATVSDPTLPDRALLPKLTANEVASANADIQRNQIGGPDGLQKDTAPSKWKGHVPDLATPRRGALVSRVVEQLKAQGLAAGRDFLIAPDGNSVAQNCL